MIITEEQYNQYKKEDNQTWYKGRRFFAREEKNDTNDTNDIWIITYIDYDKNAIYYSFDLNSTYDKRYNPMKFANYVESALHNNNEVFPKPIEKISQYIERIKANL